MPDDIAILSRVNKGQLTDAELLALAGADYTFEPYNNDFQFDSYGLIVTYTGTNKLAQSVLKSLLTNVGEHAEDINYGSALDSHIGEKVGQAMYTNLTNSVADCLKHYNAINMDNDNSDEFIETIDNVEVFGEANEPRQMTIKVHLTTESGKAVNMEFPIIKE
jgi:phage baseplate assembly protein W